MRHGVALLWLIVAGLSLAGCSRDKMGKLGRTDDACYPGKAAMHAVELDRLQLADKDFHLSESGDPIPVRVYLLNDDVEVASANGDMISGARGERDLQTPVRWEVNFSPDGRYQIVVEEQNPNGAAARYVFPPSPRPGFWPVPANDGTYKFGRSSYVHFTENVEAAQ
jgi:hypothetical protein